jgi:spore maturation protein CgeB
MNILYFTHSLMSCWNHGNAHFVRGIVRELVHRGHRVEVYEPARGWSLENLLKDHGEQGLTPFRRSYPELASQVIGRDADLERILTSADLVIVHEWNDPELVGAVGAVRRTGAAFQLLFHDTHHRAVSDPEAIRRFDLEGYDGVLAFGEALAEVYRRWGWGDRVHVWHEAADTRQFRPPQQEGTRTGLVWIGNWGDGERGAELDAFLVRPTSSAGVPLDIFGVRYPDDVLERLRHSGIGFRGWLPNALVPDVFARYLATIHVPRRIYAEQLPGIPTIRVFEALACGIPLICSPWSDSERLFRPDRDFLRARDEREMGEMIRAVVNDADLRSSLAQSGLETIRARHTCAHRVDQLLRIYATMTDRPAMEICA